MNRQWFQWIGELVRDKPDRETRRRTSPTGCRIVDHYGCGYLRNNQLIFSSEDKLTLRKRVLDELGIDPFTVRQLPKSRLAMAEFHANEKLAGEAVSRDLLLLNSAAGILRINGVQIPLHPDALVSAGLLCSNSGIQTIEHQTIVVVENLAIMSLCHAWQIPAIDKQALWVYRGDHKTGAGACRDFVKRFGADKTVIVFSDMDPKGLEIALTMPHAAYWLGPEQSVWTSCLQSKLANRDGFDKQNNALKYLERLSDNEQLADGLTQLIECFKNERSSFRQEHMFSCKAALALFSTTFAG